jgi:hypothetical protein
MESFLIEALQFSHTIVACRMFQRYLIPGLKLCQEVGRQLTLEKQKPAAGKLMVTFVE